MMYEKKMNIDVSIRNILSSLSPTLKKVGEYTVENPSKVVNFSICELAKSMNTSEASITRFCRALGFKGFTEFKTAFILEQGAHSKKTRSNINDLNIITNILDTNESIDHNSIVNAVNSIHNAKYIYILSEGTSAPIGLFLQTNLLSIGKQANLTDISQSIIFNQSNPTDVSLIIVIYNGKCTANMLQALALAKQNGIKILSISRGSNNMLMKLSDLNLKSPSTLSNKAESPLAEIIGNYFIIDKLITTLIKIDDKYKENMEKNTKNLFSMQAISNKLIDLFLS